MTIRSSASQNSKLNSPNHRCGFWWFALVGFNKSISCCSQTSRFY